MWWRSGGVAPPMGPVPSPLGPFRAPGPKRARLTGGGTSRSAQSSRAPAGAHGRPASAGAGGGGWGCRRSCGHRRSADLGSPVEGRCACAATRPDAGTGFRHRDELGSCANHKNQASCANHKNQAWFLCQSACPGARRSEWQAPFGPARAALSPEDLCLETRSVPVRPSAALARPGLGSLVARSAAAVPPP